MGELSNDEDQQQGEEFLVAAENGDLETILSLIDSDPSLVEYNDEVFFLSLLSLLPLLSLLSLPFHSSIFFPPFHDSNLNNSSLGWMEWPSLFCPKRAC